MASGIAKCVVSLLLLKPLNYNSFKFFKSSKPGFLVFWNTMGRKYVLTELVTAKEYNEKQ